MTRSYPSDQAAERPGPPQRKPGHFAAMVGGLLAGAPGYAFPVIATFGLLYAIIWSKVAT
jgi:hypothetical protein